MSFVQRLLPRHLPERCTVLEIGSGSGREAAFLTSHGYNVAGIDASANMVADALVRHPKLTPLLQTDSGMFSARVGRCRPGDAEKRFLITSLYHCT